MDTMDMEMDPFDAMEVIDTSKGRVVIYRLSALEEVGLGNIAALPFSIKVLLESLLRNIDGILVTQEDVKALAGWRPGKIPERDIPFIPSRVVLQDFTGVPAVVDLAAMRSAIERLGGDPAALNPVIPADLVIDHSVQVDYHGTSYSRDLNEKKEFERNQERYAVLRWAQTAFDNLRVVPPGRGIVHQVNLEYLASVVHFKEKDGEAVAYPDTLVGTDSHTTMINGLGVLGWGVGGIEAEAVMLGQPYYMPIPEVVGFKLYGELREGVTATDLVLRITQMLRVHGVVGKFVEFYGPGIGILSLPDRATISNMAPEYGATMGFFPVDENTLEYLLETGRDQKYVDFVRDYCREQGLFYDSDSPDPKFSDTLELDMGDVEPSLAGPKRPQDRIPMGKLANSFHRTMEEALGEEWVEDKILEHDPEYGRWLEEGGGNVGKHTREVHEMEGYIKCGDSITSITHGSVVIAAITSCTNTSNPSILIGAGLLAKKAVERGLKTKPHVKTSLAPGSRVVTDYLAASGLLPYLEALGFHVVGYGCTTCIGNSGPLSESISKEIEEKNLTVAAVLSGNRNFEGRINPFIKANYLASPLLVVAYALAGTVDIDLENEPVGCDPNGMPVYLNDIWPSSQEIEDIISDVLTPSMFAKEYSEVLEGEELWTGLEVPEGILYQWSPESTYIQEPPFFKDFPLEPPEKRDIKGARLLALLEDSITTDHISPAGAIPSDEPAGKYLISRGVNVENFNSFGSRRGNHEVMMRGTFGNIRLRNQLVPEKEGGWTRYLPTDEQMSIFDASKCYMDDGMPLVVIAGKEYGTGSSRDWAAKGTLLLGVESVIAESFERIHRSNLVGMGVLPLQFREDENASTFGLRGDETYDIFGIGEMHPRGELTVVARNDGGEEKRFNVIVRLDSPVEMEYYRNGGILHTFLRNMLTG